MTHEKIMERRSDSFFTHIFARTISRRISPKLKKYPVTPLQVTLVGLFFGLAAAWFAGQRIWFFAIAAGILVEISHILDCVDGELARLTNRGSPFAASLDPITDRIKDIAFLYSAYINSLSAGIFNWTSSRISAMAVLTIGFWLLYMYVVDAFLNPARRKSNAGKENKKKRIYMGVYDLFVYGSIFFLIFQIFEYFLLFVFLLSLFALPVQLIRLKIFLD